MGIFKVRGPSDQPESVESTPPVQPVIPTHTPPTELTKNEKYCFSRLPALPSIFQSHPELTNGYSDNESNFALALNQNSIHVWGYRSTDSTPLSIQFPIESSQMPLAILTKPSSGISKDPGLVIIDSSTGLIKFYESVQHAPALGLINNKLLELTIPLKKGEYIMLAENVEPAGVVVATSTKRCVLISLRDFKSKPQLSYVELMNLATGLFSLWGSDSSSDEIVSIKSGKITNHGISQEIIVQDSAGKFNFFTYHLSSANGSPYIEKKNSYLHDLLVHVKSSIDGYLPGSHLGVKFLDLWPYEEDIYLALCQVSESNKTDLLLLTIKINTTGVLVYGSHKLSRYDNTPFKSKPRLFLPNPSKTAFVVIDNSIIITDINVSYIQSSVYYRPRWEDIVRLKSTVEIIGCGYESSCKESSENPSLILITRNFGVLRLERFIENLEVNSSPTYTIKSHIEQGIYYTSPEINFDIRGDYSDEVIIDAIEQVSNEILESTSVYLPNSMASIKNFLLMKVDLYKKLITYSRENFSSVYQVVLPGLLSNLEKNELGLNFWLSIDGDLQLKSLLPADSKKYFSQGLESINDVFTQFLEKALTEGVALSVLSNIVVQSLYGVYLHEQEYVQNQLFKSWVFDTSLLIVIEDIFSNSGLNNIPTNDNRTNLVKYVEILYYFINNAIAYMSKFDNSQLVDYSDWYESRKSHWILILMENSLSNEALQIVEKYHDFSSLVYVLENSDTSDPYEFYFQKYGYEFASALFDHYLETDKIQDLILTNHKHFLINYFSSNPVTSKISWIRHLLDHEFAKASKALLQSATLEPDNLDNQQLKYSLAKLSKIAQAGDPITDEEVVNECENKLVQLRAQRGLFLAIEEFKNPTFEFYLAHFLNKLLNQEQRDLLKPPFQDFLANKPLPVLDLVNFLTFTNKFAEALKLVGIIENERLFRHYTKVIWLRLLTTVDDWKSLNEKIKISSEDFINEKLTGGFLFKTFVDIGMNKNLLQQLDVLLVDGKVEEENNLQTDFVLETRLEDFGSDFKTWVSSVKQEAMKGI